nr:galactoside 2-alpha-L-fucosyltransferase 2-like [Zootoca vivipara]
MDLPQRCSFSQPALVFFLYFFGLLSFSTFLYLCEKMPYQQWRNASSGIWTVNSIGRLGNQMGEYATLYALAKMNGHQAYIYPAMHQYLSPIFKITLPVINGDLADEIRWNKIGLHDWMSEDYKHIKGKYVRLTGYPCSYTFYHHIRQEILQQFSFHDHIKEETNQYLQELRGQRQEVTYVGVHVRRGDYVYVMSKIWKGVVADRGYLEKAMNYFREKYPNPIFVVTSNGMKWCKKNINASRGDVYFSGDGRESSPGRDFALLAHCNHTIMTIGTFGFWAGYLAGGETVYLANYTLPDSPFLKHFKSSAAFLPEWIGIPADLSPLLSKKPAKSRSQKLEQTVVESCLMLLLEGLVWTLILQSIYVRVVTRTPDRGLKDLF